MADRLISADKLREDVLDLPNCYNGYSDTYDKARIIDLIDEQPTVDAVPVVRCKDCKHYWKNTRESDEPVVCLASSKDDAFCSEGERRENEVR